MRDDVRSGWAALAVSAMSRAVLVTLIGLLGCSVFPVLLGWETTVVTSGSMSPALRTGDVSVIRPVAAEDVRPGQVLLVDDPDQPGGLRLHRLVDVSDGALRLKGDANSVADSSLVEPAAVHGVAVLRLPAIGLPVLWAGEQRAPVVIGTAVGVVALLLAAGCWRPEDDQPRPDRRRLPGRRSALLRGAALLTVTAGCAGLLPAPPAVAAFTARTESAGTWASSSAAVWACLDESAVRARRVYDFQEGTGTAAANTGTLAPRGNGTYQAGVTLDRPGPDCGKGPVRAVTLDGSSGHVSTRTEEADPQVFTVQVWFATTSPGGKIFGFARNQTGVGGQFDRHLYMTDTGRLVFGVYRDGLRTISSTASYADGAWHLATVTFGAAGAYLYVDGVQVDGSATITRAEPISGYWRFGWDIVDGWPDRPTNPYFRGSLAVAAVWDTQLTATQVRAQYRR